MTKFRSKWWRHSRVVYFVLFGLVVAANAVLGVISTVTDFDKVVLRALH